jgi:hypothetical protein
MARARAQFNKPPDLIDLPLLEEQGLEELRQHLRQFFPGHADESLFDETFGHPADAFVNHLLTAMDFAVGVKAWNEESLGKDEIFAEWKAIKTNLQSVSSLLKKYPGKALGNKKLVAVAYRMRHLSRDVELLLSLDADARAISDAINNAVSGSMQPNYCAETIDVFLIHVLKAESKLSQPPKRTYPARYIATELALRVIRIFEREGLSTSSTVQRDVTAKTTPMVFCLKELGDYIGINLAAKTWSEYIGFALQNGARLAKKRDAHSKNPHGGAHRPLALDAGAVMLGWAKRKKRGY